MLILLYLCVGLLDYEVFYFERNHLTRHNPATRYVKRTIREPNQEPGTRN